MITKYDVVSDMFNECGCGDYNHSKKFLDYIKKNFITKTEHYKKMKQLRELNL